MNIDNSDDAEMCNLCGCIASPFFILYPCNDRLCKSCLYPHLNEQLSNATMSVTCPACHELVFRFFLPVSNDKLVEDIHNFIYFNKTE